jgi:hypothetical protein
MAKAHFSSIGVIISEYERFSDCSVGPYTIDVDVFSSGW